MSFTRPRFGDYFKGDKIRLDIPMRNPGTPVDYGPNNFSIGITGNCIHNLGHPARRETGRYFDQVGDNLYIPKAHLLPYQKDYTLTVNVLSLCWPPTGNRIFNQLVGSPYEYCDLYRNSGWYVWAIYTVSSGYQYLTPTAYLRDGPYGWNQLTLTYEHATGYNRFYVNGKPAFALTYVHTTVASAITYGYIGRASSSTSDGYRWNGYIADFGVLDRQLEWEEVTRYWKETTFMARRRWFVPEAFAAIGAPSATVPRLAQPSYFRRRVA